MESIYIYIYYVTIKIIDYGGNVEPFVLVLLQSWPKIDTTSIKTSFSSWIETIQVVWKKMATRPHN